MSCDEYILAIERKDAIAEFHFKQLSRFVGRFPDEKPVPIPVQAHFEGILMSTIAAADQIAAGLWVVAGLGTERGGLDATFRHRDADRIESRSQSQIRDLWFDMRMQDVREVRRRMTHLYYDKPVDRSRYFVKEYPVNRREKYVGNLISDREILQYSETTLELLRQIVRAGHSALEEHHR